MICRVHTSTHSEVGQFAVVEDAGRAEGKRIAEHLQDAQAAEKKAQHDLLESQLLVERLCAECSVESGRQESYPLPIFTLGGGGRTSNGV